MKEHTKGRLVAISIIAIFAGSLIVIAFPVRIDPNIQRIDSIVYCNAPFGTYWVEADGTMCFLIGRIDSELQESYTVKFLEGNEVVTVLIKAAKTRVTETYEYHVGRVFLSDTKSWHLDIFHEKGYNVFGWKIYDSHDPIYYLYIPNPSLFGYSTGPWENLTKGEN